MSPLRILPAFGLLCLFSRLAEATPTVNWTCSPSSTVDVGQQYTLTVTASPGYQGGYQDTIITTLLQRAGATVANGTTVATYTNSETTGGTVTFTALVIFTNAPNYQYGVTYTSPPFTLTARPNHPPTISWVSAPTSVTYGQQYLVEAQGQDVDGDMTTVNVYKNGQPFAFALGASGDGTPVGQKAVSGNLDTAPGSLQQIQYTAVAIDARGNHSSTISLTVNVLSPNAPVLDESHYELPYIYQTTNVIVNGHDVDGDMKSIGSGVPDADNPVSPDVPYPGAYNISFSAHNHHNPGPYVVYQYYYIGLSDWSGHLTTVMSAAMITQNRAVGLPTITTDKVSLVLGNSLNLTTAQHDADGNLTQHMMYYQWMPVGATSYGEQQLLTTQQQYQNGVYDAAYQFVWTPTAAGTYQIYAYGTDPYSTAQSTPITVTVDRLPNTITFSLPNQSYVYGQPFYVNAYASSGLTVYYTTDPSSAGNATYSGTTGTATRAGSLTIWAHQDGDATHNAATPMPQTVTVQKATPTVTWASPAAITYGAALSSTQLNATASVPGTFVYTPALGTVLGTGSQTLSVTFTPTDTTNYASVTTTTSLVVNKASLIVTANNVSRVYGASNPALTYTVTGLVNGDSASVVTGVTVISTAGTASAAGTYPITASGGTAANYNLAYVAGTLTVTKAGLTITANNASRVYGTANPALTYGVTGLVNGDTASVVTGVSVATAATAGSGVGGYPITASGGSSTNYTLSYMPGTLTVTAAGLTITASNQSRVYGSANPTLTYSVGGLVNGDTASVVTGVGVATTATAGSGVGGYPITASGGSATNYTLSYVPGTLTVTAAGLTITANNQSRAYGSANPTLTYSVGGLVNGDTASVVTGVGVATTATAGSGVGGYPITASGGSAANYTLSYAPGTLSVTPAVLTIAANNQSRAYGATNPTLTYAVSGLKNGDAASVVTGVTLNTTAVPASGAGTYPITGSGGSAANYTLNYVNGTLTVNAATLTITANDASRAYGVANPTFTYSVTGLVNGDAATVVTGVSVTSPAGANSPAGTYPIVPSGGSAANYTLSYVNGTLTISVLAITSQPLSHAVIAGGSVSLSVGANGAPPLTYQWRKNGVAISGATGATLTLSNVQLADTAAYDVVVSSSGASLISMVAEVVVSDPQTSSDGGAVPTSWPNQVSTTNSDVVGMTAGQLSVDKSGALKYSVPLWVVPGTAGMQPQLALNYSSQAGAGIAGFGWSLGGISVITRGPQTLATDNHIHGVDYSTDDRFYLDGQRLIAISGSDGADGTEYRTEIESFSKVVSYGTAGTGPSYFKVWTKAGLIMEFGNTADSAAVAVGRSEVATWAVNKISDTSGNFMTFTYSRDAPNGEQRLKEIDYSGHGSSSTFASVNFGYEARNDTSTGYVAGSKVSRTQRLKTILAYYGTTLVRQYTLDYVNRDLSSGDQLGRSILTTLHEADGAGNERPPLKFDYDQAGSGFDQPTNTNWNLGALLAKDRDEPQGSGFVDLDGDGRPDFIVFRVDSSGNTVSRGAWLNKVNGWVPADGSVSGVPDWRSPVFIAADGNGIGFNNNVTRILDIDGDGRPDIYCNGRVYLNTGAGFPTTPDSTWAIPSLPQSLITAPTGPQNQTCYFDQVWAEHQRPLFADLNGDGRVDMCAFSQYRWYYYVQGGGKEYVFTTVGEVWMNTGSGWQSNRSYAPPYLTDQGAKLIDVNGDGLPDVVWSVLDVDGYYHQGVAINTGSEFNVLASNYSKTFVTPNPLDNTRYYAPVLFNTTDANGNALPVGTEVVDLNGDGLPDLVCRNDVSGTSHGNSAWLNTGNGWTAAPSGFLPTSELSHASESRGSALIDINSDGIPDFLQSYDGSYTAHLGGATGWAANAAAYALPYTLALPDIGFDGVDLLDLNGDGAVDEIWSWSDHYGNVTKGVAFNHALPADHLKSVTNGFGVGTTITYAPLTARDSTGAFVVYDKSSPNSNVEPGAIDSISPSYVVKSVTYENGTTAGHVVDYRYGGMRMHRLRGNLGFATITASDELTGIVSVTSNRQDYPFIGMPSSSVTVAPAPTAANPANTVTISSRSTSYSQNLLNSNRTRFVYADTVTATNRDLNGDIVSHSTSTFSEYDSHGNVKTVTVDSGDGVVKMTTNTYTDDETKWFLGRLTKSSVVSSATGTDPIPRLSSFSYYSDTGLLHEEVAEPKYNNDATATTEATPAPDGHDTLRTTYEYDGWGNKKKVTVKGWDDNANDFVSRVTQTACDTVGRLPISSTNALNQTETYDLYDQGLGVLKRMTGPNGLPTSWTYDGLGTKTGEYRADGTSSAVTVHWVDTTSSTAPSGALYFIESAASGAAPTLTFYDKFARKIETIGLDGNGQMIFQETAYDALGRAYESSVPHRNGGTVYWTKTTSYDVLNRPLTVQTPDDEVTSGYVTSSFTYSGLTVDATDAKGRVTRTRKNQQGWIMSVTRDLGGLAETAVSFGYDALGNMLSSAAAGMTTSMTYDTRGRKMTMTDPDMGGIAHGWSYHYNAFGELTSQTDANSHTTTLVHDALGRIVSRTDTPEGTTTWTYDTATHANPPAIPNTSNPTQYYPSVWIGKLASVSAPGYAESYSYDPYGRASIVTRTIDGHGYSVAQTYDAYSRPYVTVYPTGYATMNVYNAFGFTKSVRHATSDGLGGFQYSTSENPFWRADSYAIDGRVDGETLGNTVTGDRVYSPATGRLLGAGVGLGSTSEIQFLVYGYDAMGNVTNRNDVATGHSESFVYDTLDRLTTYTAVTGLGRTMVSTSYDTMGNITAKSDAGTYNYDNIHGGPHAVTSVSGTGALAGQSYTYDNNGNMLTGGGRTATWSSFNQVQNISDSSGHYSTFYFGAAHERVKQVSNSGTTLYVGGIWEKVTSADGASQEEKNYVVTPAGLVAMASFGTSLPVGGSIKYFHTDGLGSITAVSDASGSVIERFAYDAWGRRSDALAGTPITSANNAHVTRGFTGHEMLDDLGLIHMNGRVYDPVLGRFLSADPNIDGADDSQGYNRYSYVGNNPMNRTDPSGYFSWRHWYGYAVFGEQYFIQPHFFNTYGGEAQGIVVTAVVSAFTMNPALGPAAGGFAAGFTNSLLNGGSLGDAFTSGTIGGMEGTEMFMAGYLAGPVGAAAAAGGISESHGGSFGAGFASSLAGSIMNRYVPAGGIIAAAVVGGTVSVIGGGKFGSGAMYAAFAYVVNGTGEELESDGDVPSAKTPPTITEGPAAGDMTTDNASTITKTKGDVTLTTITRARYVHGDTRIKFFFDDPVVTQGDDAGITGIDAIVVRDTSGHLNITLIIEVTINGDNPQTRVGAKAIAVQFGELQHVRDYWEARSTMLDNVAEMAAQFPKMEGLMFRKEIMDYYRDIKRQTISRYDSEGGPHNGGVIAVPKDFHGFPDSWWVK